VQGKIKCILEDTTLLVGVKAVKKFFDPDASPTPDSSTTPNGKGESSRMMLVAI
jgi:hypothetical protein